jgi:hypothetical protein
MTFESSRAAAEVAVILANHRKRAKLPNWAATLSC